MELPGLPGLGGGYVRGFGPDGADVFFSIHDSISRVSGGMESGTSESGRRRRRDALHWSLVAALFSAGSAAGMAAEPATT